MKKRVTKVVALVLALVMLFPAAAFASPLDEVSSREVNGEIFVPLRYTAEAFGWTVDWDSEARSIILVDPTGVAETLVMNDLLVHTDSFVEDGRTWISLELAFLLFVLAQPEMPEPDFIFPLTAEARDIVMEDFMFLINFIVENSTWDNVFDRANPFGISFREVIEFYLDLIESMEPFPVRIVDEDIFRMAFPIQEGTDARSLAANYLFAMLLLDFALVLNSIGHLGPRTLDLYSVQVDSFYREMRGAESGSAIEAYFTLLLEAFLHPSARWFYGEIDIDLNAEPATFPAVPGNIVTEHIVPGEVAYLRINSFLTDMAYDDAIILPFLQSVRDYEHLILDVRGNIGGSLVYFPQLIFRRLINEPVEVQGLEFFAGGDAAVAVMNAMYAITQELLESDEDDSVISISIQSANAFVAERGMTLFNASDLASLEYVMVSHSRYFPGEDAVGFDGTIWLLVDEMSMSASVLAAQLAISTGFATVVGENTSGVLASTHTYVALPNTGIVWRIDIGYQTDAYGRSLEVYGVAPDVLNFPGMDALETVFVLIAAGADSEE